MASDLELKHQHDLEKIRETAFQRQQAMQQKIAFDAETERLRGENERALARLEHELSIENRNLDIQFRNYQDAQQIRLESLQTIIKQHDDYFRFFWELEKEVVQTLARIAEHRVQGRIQQDQTKLEHSNTLEAEADRRVTITLEAKLERKKMRLKNELDKDFEEFKLQLRHKYQDWTDDELEAMAVKLYEEQQAKDNL